MLQRVVLGLGSNIGKREQFLKKAIKKLYLSKDFLFIVCSKIYESEPWGFKNQNKFLNCVIIGLYRSRPEILHAEIDGIEQKLGRTRQEKWHPREIDIDILFYGDKILNKKKLIIPHPFIESRNFVLKPLSELMPGFIHPVLKKSIQILYRNSPDKNKVVLYKNQII